MRLRLPWMSRADRARWQDAQTLADLGHLTAQWLEGTLTSRPAYQPRFGPEEETLPLVPVLAAANRAGYLTEDSQPGTDETARGHHWQQRAAVSGFVTDPALLTRLRTAAEHAGLLVIQHPPGSGYIPCEHVVSTCDGEPVTRYGGRLGEADLRLHYADIGPQALADLLQATRLTLVDPEFGPSDRLWNALQHAATRSRDQLLPHRRPLDGPALYALIGAAGSGKTTLSRHWPTDAVLELDVFRAQVAGDAGDQGATPDAVAALELILEARLSRGLTCVLDATHAELAVRRTLVAAAHRHGMPAVAVLMETDRDICHLRNDSRPRNRRVPVQVLDEQYDQALQFNATAEGFDQTIRASQVRGLLRPAVADAVTDAISTVHAGLSQLESLARFQDDTALIARMLRALGGAPADSTTSRGATAIRYHDDNLLAHLTAVLTVLADALPVSRDGRTPGTTADHATADTAQPEALHIARQLHGAARTLKETERQQIAPALAALAAHGPAPVSTP